MPEPDTEFQALLAPVLAQISLQLDSGQIAHLREHYELLEKWNRRLSLTAIREPREVVSRHFGESLFLAKMLKEVKTVVDVGSGAGFPGAPLAVARPAIKVTLVESISKKVTFLKEATRALTNVSVYHGRVDALMSHFDCSTCRAVDPEEILPQLRRISNSVALLVGESAAEQLWRDRSVDWSEPVALPWGKRLVLVTGIFRPVSDTQGR